jgi:hypothetical protein
MFPVFVHVAVIGLYIADVALVTVPKPPADMNIPVPSITPACVPIAVGIEVVDAHEFVVGL